MWIVFFAGLIALELIALSLLVWAWFWLKHKQQAVAVWHATLPQFSQQTLSQLRSGKTASEKALRAVLAFKPLLPPWLQIGLKMANRLIASS